MKVKILYKLDDYDHKIQALKDELQPKFSYFEVESIPALDRYIKTKDSINYIDTDRAFKCNHKAITRDMTAVEIAKLLKRDRQLFTLLGVITMSTLVILVTYIVMLLNSVNFI